MGLVAQVFDESSLAVLDGHLGMVDQILDRLVHHQAPIGSSTGSARDPEGDLHDDEHGGDTDS